MDYRGPFRIRIKEKPYPRILHPNDAIVRVLRSCICGSDLHLYHGMVPDTRVGETFGHEFIGVVEEIGESVHKLKTGIRLLFHLILPVVSALSANKDYIVHAMKLIRREMAGIRIGDTVVVFGGLN